MRKILYLLSALILFASCCSNSQDAEVTAKLKERIEQLKTANSSSNAVALSKTLEKELLLGETSLSNEEVEYLKFLYAYMPINDLSEQDFNYFVNTTKQALKAKELPWGSSLTPELFKYFVLPPRVNNESLDNAREIFYNELVDRVKDLPMYDAVIEINHWCREKIVYTPTDGRTTPPSQTAARAYGRCGEESTVAVAALRAMSIPARQVYVPRWAHTNSNHAWVEVWVDGRWYYLGACEPEPMLDRGWFTASASRAMLVNTFACGNLEPSKKSQIDGEIISKSPLFTEISSTSTYAPVKKAVVKVVDNNKQPIEGAKVLFQIINGNYMSTMAERYTDNSGVAYLTSGLGTFVIEVYANKDNKEYYAIEELSVPSTGEIEIVLDGDARKANSDGSIKIADFRITPPAETRFPTALSAEMQKEHDIKCAKDDDIRVAYTSTFLFSNKAKVEEFSKKMVSKGLSKKLNTKLEELLSNTLVNGNEVANFLNSTNGKDLDLAVELLGIVRVKDLQEITAAEFKDYLDGVLKLGNVYKDNAVYKQSILNPRFSNELPAAYKELLWSMLEENGMKAPGASKETIKAVTSALNNIVLVNDADYNPRDFEATPASIAKFGMADSGNYTIYARALFSTAGIPNRVDFLNSIMYIYVDNEWVEYDIKSLTKSVDSDESLKATLIVKDPIGIAAERQYVIQKWSGDAYQHIRTFTLESKNVKDGKSFTVDAGMYRIISGIRAADGAVLTRTMTFEVEPKSTKEITVEWYPIEADELVVIGSMNAEWKYTPKEAKKEGELTSILNTVGRNFFVLAFLEPTKEPSQHYIRELSSMGGDLKLPIVTIFNDKDKMDFYFKQNYKLSDKINYGYDWENEILKGLEQSLKTTDLQARLPVIVVADSFGNIFYTSIGYNIGVPEAISKLELPIHE